MSNSRQSVWKSETILDRLLDIFVLHLHDEWKINILVIHIFFIEFVIAKQICISFWKLG